MLLGTIISADISVIQFGPKYSGTRKKSGKNLTSKWLIRIDIYELVLLFVSKAVTQ